MDLSLPWRMGIIFCGKHPLLLTRIQVSESRDHGPSCLIVGWNFFQIGWGGGGGGGGGEKK